MKNNSSIIARVATIAGLALGAFALSALATGGTWTAPTQTPPAGNVDAPINVGGGGAIGTLANYIQTKAGTLILNDLVANNFQFVSTTADGYVLTSDAIGKARWAAPSGGSGGTTSYFASDILLYWDANHNGTASGYTPPPATFYFISSSLTIPSSLGNSTPDFEYSLAGKTKFGLAVSGGGDTNLHLQLTTNKRHIYFATSYGAFGGGVMIAMVSDITNNKVNLIIYQSPGGTGYTYTARSFKLDSDETMMSMSGSGVGGNSSTNNIIYNQ